LKDKQTDRDRQTYRDTDAGIWRHIRDCFVIMRMNGCRLCFITPAWALTLAQEQPAVTYRPT